MAKGDTQLIMSMVLVVTGSGLFMAGMGSKNWVTDVDHSNHTITYGLWEKCFHVNGTDFCTVIKPGSTAAYFEATRVLVCVALLVYCTALCSCFTADDRQPSESWEVCIRRYIHVVLSFAAALTTFLIIVVFGASYESDDWFLRPSLGVSYWLTLAGCLSMTGGAVMRVVFIVWPDRPQLPLHKNMPAAAPQAPRRRRRQNRVDDQLGPEALPTELRPGEVVQIRTVADEPAQIEQGKEPAKQKKTSGIRRLFAFFSSSKKSKVTAKEGTGHGDSVETGAVTAASQTTLGNRADSEPSSQQALPGLKPAIRTSMEAYVDTSDAEMSDAESTTSKVRRLGRRKDSEQAIRRKKKRVSIADTFTGYNIPPTPGPDLPDTERMGKQFQDSRPVSRGYELALEDEDLRTRTVKTPPAVVHPLPGDQGHILEDGYLDEESFVEGVKRTRRGKR